VLLVGSNLTKLYLDCCNARL